VYYVVSRGREKSARSNPCFPFLELEGDHPFYTDVALLLAQCGRTHCGFPSYARDRQGVAFSHCSLLPKSSKASHVGI